MGVFEKREVGGVGVAGVGRQHEAERSGDVTGFGGEMDPTRLTRTG